MTNKDLQEKAPRFVNLYIEMSSQNQELKRLYAKKGLIIKDTQNNPSEKLRSEIDEIKSKITDLSAKLKANQQEYNKIEKDVLEYLQPMHNKAFQFSFHSVTGTEGDNYEVTLRYRKHPSGFPLFDNWSITITKQ